MCYASNCVLSELLGWVTEATMMSRSLPQSIPCESSRISLLAFLCTISIVLKQTLDQGESGKYFRTYLAGTSLHHQMFDGVDPFSLRCSMLRVGEFSKVDWSHSIVAPRRANMHNPFHAIRPFRACLSQSEPGATKNPQSPATLIQRP